MYLNTFIFALILASGLGSPIFEYEAKPELARMKILMDAFLKWLGPAVYSQLKHGSTMFSNLTGIELNSTSLDAKIYVSYLTFEKISMAEIAVDNYKIDPTTLASTFRITLPHISETYKYKINGTILSHEVSGEGRLTYGTTNPSITVSDLKFHDSPHNLQIASMKIDTEINNLIIKFNGLRVAGMELNAFTKILQAEILSLLKEKLHFSKADTTAFEGEVDRAMHGKSLKQVVKWLKQHTKKVPFE